MADLKETDEPVEKAVKLSRPLRGKLRRNSAAIIRRLDSGEQRLGDGQRYGRIKRALSMHTRTSVRKSSDPLTTLYAEIEKARGKGLIRGGSKRLQRKMQGRAYGSQEWSWGTARGARAHRANKYLATRTGKDVGGATPARTYRGQGGLSPRQRVLRFRTGKYK